MDAVSNAAAAAKANVGDVSLILPEALKGSVELVQELIETVIDTYPPVLTPLILKTQIFVKQKLEGVLPACLCVAGIKNKRYDVKDAHGKNIYHIIEDSNSCCRFCLKSHRPFHLAIQDDESHAIVVHRRLACDSCLFGCCLNEIIVSTETGKHLGRVKQNWTCCKSKFEVHNAQGDIVCKIKGPVCPCSACGGNVDFEIFTVLEGVKIGAITKYWSGIATEIFTAADSFSVTFPADMDPEVKATLIGACLLIVTDCDDDCYFRTWLFAPFVSDLCYSEDRFVTVADLEIQS